jgi:hypothetical protein
MVPKAGETLAIIEDVKKPLSWGYPAQRLLFLRSG